MSVEATQIEAFDVVFDHIGLVVVGRVLLRLQQVDVDQIEELLVVAGGDHEVGAFELGL